MHLIADEVDVGFGRTGTLFACEQAGITPDFLCLSKGLTGGFLPLSVVLTREQVYEAFVDPRIHAAFTAAPATGSRRLGGRFSAWDGYIMGVHRELVPGVRIVQDWLTTEWP